MEIREAGCGDLEGLLQLYAQLHGDPAPGLTESVKEIWQTMLEDPKHHVVLGCVEGKIVSSCVITVIPNLTHGQRPYALIENVITDEAHRGRGYATAVLDYAQLVAAGENTYKLMLMTGSKRERTLEFYERAGYDRSAKTAFVKKLEEKNL